MAVTGIGPAAQVDPVASLVTALNAATAALTTSTASSLQKSSNLSDLVSASTALTNLGLKVAAPRNNAALDAAAIQAAHDALPADGGVLMLQASPLGSAIPYDITSGVTFSKPTTLIGCGMGVGRTLTGPASLVSTSATGNAITITAHGCSLKDFMLVNTATTPTAGAGILASKAENLRLENLTVAKFYNNVDMGASSGVYWQMSGCHIQDPMNYGVYLHNTEPTYDWADPVIQGCVFTNYTSRTPAAAMRWESGGGLRFINSKINCGPQSGTTIPSGAPGKFVVGLDYQVADGASTGVMEIVGNSLENCYSRSIRIGQKAGGANTGQVRKFTITGNEIGLLWDTTGIGIEVGAIASTGLVTDVSIATNTIQYCQGGGISVYNTVGVAIGKNHFCGTMGALVTIAASPDTGANSRGIDVATQSLGTQGSNAQIALDSIDIVVDNRSRSSGPTFDGTKELSYSRHVFLNSAGTWVTMWRVDPIIKNNHGAGIIEVTFSGSDFGVGPNVVKQVRSFTYTSGTIALATVGTDVAAGGGTHLGVQFDTSVSGQIAVQAQMTTGGTTWWGQCHIRVIGDVLKFRKGA